MITFNARFEQAKLIVIGGASPWESAHKVSVIRGSLSKWNIHTTNRIQSELEWVTTMCLLIIKPVNASSFLSCKG